MSRSPIRIRTFILATLLVLLLVPAVSGGAAWLIERDHQQAGTRQRLRTAFAYLSSDHGETQASVPGFARLLNRLNLLAQLVVVTTSPPGKRQLYLSPALSPALQKEQARQANAPRSGKSPAPAAAGASATGLDESERLIPIVTAGSRATLIADLYYPAPSRATRELVALLTAVTVLLAGLAVAVWLAGRWMVAPLARLSAQVDKVAGGDLTLAVPHSRIGEVENIAQAVEGMTDALDQNARQRAEADEARRFLVTSVAHDLRTPLFALRGHLQAIGSGVGDPALHLRRAEARADALERLVGNLFAYARDDAQPAPQLEALPVADLLQDVTAGLEHTTRLRDNSFELAGDQALAVVVDRDRLKRALTNVLDNALRYSPPGASIQLSWAAANRSTVQITVQDHGPGIDPELLPHIFEPGVRGVPAAGSPDGGAGLGLTIARRLLEHQHAAIAVCNEPSGGARISLTLQRAPSTSPPATTGLGVGA